MPTPGLAILTPRCHVKYLCICLCIEHTDARAYSPPYEEEQFSSCAKDTLALNNVTALKVTLYPQFDQDISSWSFHLVNPGQRNPRRFLKAEQLKTSMAGIGGNWSLLTL